MKWLYKLIPHKGKYAMLDILVIEYAQAYGKLYLEQNGVPLIYWDKFKNLKPKCQLCGSDHDH